MNNRRESRIPRATLADKSNNIENTGNTADRKRKTAGAGASLIAVPESKRLAGSFNTSTKPVKAATQPFAVAAALRSDTPKQQHGPESGEETFEDISTRTGATVSDILVKRMQFKKGIRPEKKVEEMVPMIKEIRAVAWYLQAGKERADLDCEQWKTHSEQLESDMAAEKQSRAEKEDAFEQELGDKKVLLEQAQERCSKAESALTLVEATLSEHASGLQSLQRLLVDTEDKLGRAIRDAAEKEAKIKGMEEVMHHSQGYSSTLQTYNTTLQVDLNNEKAKREEIGMQRDLLQNQVAELAGKLVCSEDRSRFDQVQADKMREERDKAVVDLSLLRADLDSSRYERDRLLADTTCMKEDYDRIRQLGGQSLETLETLANDKATLEVQLSTQQKLIASMREELGMSKEQWAMAESQSDARKTQVENLKVQMQLMHKALEAAEKRAHDGELVRRKLHNTIQELKGNIRVFCRVRPISALEQASMEHDSALALEFPAAVDPLTAGVTLQAPGRDASAANARHTFTFDRVFTPEARQEAVFEEISELIQSALDGHKVCIFAYGQTGSGKTFTMLGDHEQPGMIPRAMRQIFESSKLLEQQGWTFTMQASMLEIYNEEYKDLLSKRPGSKASHMSKETVGTDAKKHQVMHTADGVTTVTDMTVVDISQASRVDTLLAEAMEKRSVGCTALNEQSSRSHMVFTMRLDGVNEAKGKRVSGVLNLIDLAGSERTKDSGAAGVRMKEAQSINTSLSALGDVIVALSNKQQHIPFRNSKLTYLLQPCLGGDAKTLMFVNVAPTMQFSGESLCSLRFAAKVNACEINLQRKK